MFDRTYSDSHLTLGIWDCRDAHTGWSDPEPSRDFEIVVTVRGCLVRERHGDIVAATSNVALLANPGDTARFRHPRGEPDRCLVILLGETAMQDAARTSGGTEERFRTGSAALPPTAFLTLRRLMDAAERSGGHLDPVRAKEAVGGVVAATLTGTASCPPPSGSTPAVEARHARAVERAAAFMAAEYRRPLTLDAIAREAAYSPFHFARVFRAHTGIPVHQFLTRLRLRTAVAALLDGVRDIGGLALELGYSSHSHFTDAFRAEYGLTPSALRGRRRMRDARTTSPRSSSGN
jgi:AraC family transcriptional regulator